MSDYLHNHPEFGNLLNILADEMNILPVLVEKDYWIMHVLHGLKKQGFQFELKGGTSLSKGYQIIERFSEDIDIHITPPDSFGINENPKNIKPKNIEARKKFYDWLAENIKINGIISIKRDHAFDNEKTYTSGGIRLYYESKTDFIEGVKEGILLEAGFDNVTPNTKLTISSWMYNRAIETASIEIIDNRAVDIVCYNPGYTFVEKLQTIATKFRKEQDEGGENANYLRQYYDIYCLLDNEEVQKFIETKEYIEHKEKRFPKADLAIPMKENEAFLLNDPTLRKSLKERFSKTANLYYRGQPDFEDILQRIKDNIDRL
jgi:Nucleotidyl transferase AbiEii toxin, Type IV TA system